ncbi:dipeptide epimerase [Oenococcus oeni]|uniref:dipeptide epimerase n=1 Tax=Oenococcus oeni TaxID=1247 RepID=UPI0008F82853|nr:dipeptide epimerase [Oenococcus oeni]OIK56855.1 dipeptide epimerase [Oenococcus oeni]OIM63339.1 dipeptide epimerase [Oenococcus oeni]
MKIVDCKLAHYSVSLKTTFKTALHAQNFANGWIVRLKSEMGNYGYGEAIPSLRVTGDSDASIFGSLKEIIFPAIIGKNFENIGKFDDFVSKLITQNSAARNAVSEGTLDLFIKDEGTNLESFFNLGKGKKVETDYTLSINNELNMLNEAKKLSKKGFSTLKIKLGDDLIEKEVQKLVYLNDHLENISFRIDANQAWNLRGSLRFDQLAFENRLPIETIEQPLPIGFEDEYSYLIGKFHFPIILDESVHEFNDARKLNPGVDFNGYNVKLEKNGGISQAKALLDYSESLDKNTMIGCMIESNIGIAFAAALAKAYPIVKFIDLDSPLMFTDEIFKGWLNDEQTGFSFNSQFVETDALRGLSWQ